MNSVLNAAITKLGDIVTMAAAASIDGHAPAPSTAKKEFDGFLNDYKKTGVFPSNPAQNWIGKPSNLPKHDTNMDQELKLNLQKTNGGFILQNTVSAFWEMMVIYEKKLGGYYYRHKPHKIYHLEVRLNEEGYNLYRPVTGKKTDGLAVVTAHIDGRDIVYMAAMLALPKIIEEIKNILLYEVFA